MSNRVLAAVLMFLSITAPYLFECAYAQPTWSFKIVVLPAQLYMGEWGVIQVNITNTDCERRENFLLKFNSLSEKKLGEILERCGKMRSLGMIHGYSLMVERRWYEHGVHMGDYTLILTGACVGRKIEIVSLGIWFPFERVGRGRIFWNDSRRTLEAFNPVKFVVEGVDPASSTLLSVKVYVPEDISTRELSKKPQLDVRVRHPAWLEYTLESYPVEENHAVIMPYRTFNLTVKDFDGVNPVPGAKVVMRRLVHYYDVREYVTSHDGVIRIRRLLDDDYRVEVYWNSSYSQEYPFIYFEQVSAEELAGKKEVRTSLFNLRIRLVDVHGRPVDGALTILDGVEKIAERGGVTYPMVPQGNHTALVYWKGVKVFDGWVWAGYHPTIYPWVARPAVEHVLKLDVGDLIVSSVDSGGNVVGANFTVIGPNRETSFGNIYSRAGLLNLSQLPMADYLVRAVNYSRSFKNVVEHSGVFRPGERAVIQLPVHSLRIRMESMTGRPLEGVELRVGPVASRTDREGYALFAGVPSGEYEVLGEWLGVKVYTGRVRVEGAAEKILKANVYDVRIRLLDSDGEEHPSSYLLIDPAGRLFTGRGVTLIELDNIPEGSCKLAILDFLTGRELFNKTLPAREISGVKEIRLPVSDMLITVRWVDGEPVSGAEVEVVEQGGTAARTITDHGGRASLEKQFFSRYAVTVYYPNTRIAVGRQEVRFEGRPLNFTVEPAFLIVRVVDLLGNPVAGAEVEVTHLGAVLGRMVTDGNGLAVFRRLLRVPIYDVQVYSWGLQSFQKAWPGASLEVKLEYVNLAGLILRLSDLMSMAAIAVTAAIISLAVTLVRRFLRRLTKRTAAPVGT